MSSSASRKFCAGTSSEPVLDLIGEPGSSFRSESLRLGIPEALSSGGGAGAVSPRTLKGCLPGERRNQGKGLRCPLIKYGAGSNATGT
jgi:hypothetical protein